MALETAPWRRILNADRRASVLIGECTSDNGVHVHRNAISMCAPALPYVAGCLTVAARPAERRRRSGAFGRRRERPPLWGCLDRHRGGCACAHPWHPPPGGVAPDHQSLAGRPPSAAESAADQRTGLAFGPHTGSIADDTSPRGLRCGSRLGSVIPVVAQPSLIRFLLSKQRPSH